ncbi:hypothetical protein D3C84_1229870 [compost metagenome]
MVLDDFTISVDWGKVGSDGALRNQLLPYDKCTLAVPKGNLPKLDYLQRRRALTTLIE